MRQVIASENLRLMFQPLVVEAGQVPKVLVAIDCHRSLTAFTPVRNVLREKGSLRAYKGCSVPAD